MKLLKNIGSTDAMMYAVTVITLVLGIRGMRHFSFKSIHLALESSRTMIGVDISPTACRVMAKRLRDVCALPESEALWRAGRGFVVRNLPCL